MAKNVRNIETESALVKELSDVGIVQFAIAQALLKFEINGEPILSQVLQGTIEVESTKVYANLITGGRIEITIEEKYEGES
mgnify:CR=1 FL=1